MFKSPSWINDAYFRLKWDGTYPTIVGMIAVLERGGMKYFVTLEGPMQYALRWGAEVVARTRRNKTTVAWKHLVKIAKSVSLPEES